jgi:phage gpG-like protein
MSDPLSLKVEGLAAFRRDLRKVDREVDKDLRQDIKDAAGRVLVEARGLAPMRTGALARSLKVSVTAKGASVYSTLPYAPVLHWGGTIAPRGAQIRFPRTEFISGPAERAADRLAEEISESVERAALRAGWH